MVQRKSFMRFYLYRLLAITGLCIISVFSGAQTNNIKFSNLSEVKGFNNTSIVCIFQDNSGFLWFGTYGGLFRYDGNSFREFQPIRNHPGSLVNGHIRSICQDSSGVMYIGTINGLSVYYPETEEFRRFFNNPKDPYSISNNTIYKVFTDHSGTVWVGTFGGGLDKIEKIRTYKNKKPVDEFKFIHLTEGEGKKQLSSNKITDIAETPDGNLWIGTQNGLNCFDRKKNQVIRFLHNPADAQSISNDNISSLCVDKQGNVWAGTWEKGLNLLDPQGHKFVRFFNDPNNKYSLSHNIIMELYCDNSGTVWVGTWGGGLNKVVPPGNGVKNWAHQPAGTFKFITYRNDKSDFKSITGNSIYSIMQDKTGTIWVGTDWNGLNYFHIRRDKFIRVSAQTSQPCNLIDNVVFTLFLDKSNMLWIGTKNGINTYNRKTGKYTLYQHNPLDPQSLSTNEVRCIIQDRKGDIWIGTTQGLNKFNKTTQRFTRYYQNSARPGTTNILSIYEDVKGILWLGTYEEGLLRFDPGKSTFEKYVHNPDNPNSISDNIIWTIYELENNKLLIGTEKGGLCEFDPVSKKFKTFMQIDPNNLSMNTIYSIKSDHLNNIWLCTLEGLNKMVRNARGEISYIPFTRNLVNGFVEDDRNNIWLLTNAGLGLFHQADSTIKYFIANENAETQQFSINAISYDTLNDVVLFGGLEGYYIFDLRKEEDISTPPVSKLVNLRLFNRVVNIREEVNNKIILTHSISYTKKLALTHKEFVIGFEYSALHFSSPEENKYAYILEGFDQEWNYVGNQHIATYTNLPPGNYTFKVKAANPDGIWNDESPASIHLVIKPAWWETRFFKLLLLLLILGFAFSVNRIRISILKGRQRILEDMVSKRTEELSYANILLKEKQEEITMQNEELVKHRNELEKLVAERTHELTVAKDKAEESDKLKSAFLANMSHEIRTPMNAIVGFSNLLDDDALDHEEKEAYIQTIKNNSDTLLTIINDILDISIIEANQLVLFRELFCIDDVLKELRSYYLMRNEKELDIRFTNEQENINTFICNDSVRFRQIMINLLNNAYKYTENGSIKFGYEVKGNAVQFFVEDTGVGISKENSAKVFNDFHKIEPYANRFHQGTGIGLSISKKLVNLMGGEIYLQSTLNKGSVFYFTLPNEDANKMVRNITGDAIAEKGLQNITIVVAEDEPDNYRLIEKLLKKTGATVVWVQNGQEAVDYFGKIKDFSHHLILMDIKMPVMNGIEACKRIKKMNSAVPIIATTAFAQAGDRESIMNNGFNEYVSKPLNFQKLWKAICTVVPIC
jgi:signal transduction histidine kinase/ligand-binding sensor domain-containing protein/CheY-like chemotaxis protein